MLAAMDRTLPIAERYAALDRLGRRQHGLVTTAQLERLGFDRHARGHLLDTHRLSPVRRGVYRCCGAGPSWRSAALAAVMAAGGEAVLSHHSAGALWGLFEEQDLMGDLHITSPAQVRLHGVRAHRRQLLPGDTSVRHGVAVTSIERTLVDLSETVPAKTTGGLLDEAVRRRYTSVGRVERRVVALEGLGRRRLGTIRRVLSERGAGYDPGANDWEQRMDRMWEQMGLPPAVRQYTITLPNGRKYRPDRAIVEERIAVDWNGYAWHGLRSDFERDIERRNALIAAGWTPLEFHSNQPARHICATVLRVHERQRATSLPAS